MPWELLAGPAALAVAASLAVIALWRQHAKDDADKSAALKALTDAAPNTAAAIRDLIEVVKDAMPKARR